MGLSDDLAGDHPEEGTCFLDEHGGITAIVEAQNFIYQRAALRYMLWSFLGLDMDKVPDPMLQPILEEMEEIQFSKITTQRNADTLDLPMGSWHPLGDGRVVLLGYRLKKRTMLYDLDDALGAGA